MPRPVTLGLVTRWTDKGPKRHVRIHADKDEAQFFIRGLRVFSMNLSTGKIRFRKWRTAPQRAIIA